MTSREKTLKTIGSLIGISIVFGVVYVVAYMMFENVWGGVLAAAAVSFLAVPEIEVFKDDEPKKGYRG